MSNQPDSHGSTSTKNNLGWKVVTWRWFRHPPEAVAGIVYVALVLLSVFGFLLVVTLTAIAIIYLFSSTVSNTPTSGEAARNLLIAVGGLVSIPFFIWRAYVGHWQARTAAENYTTGLMIKAAEQLGAMREVKTAVLDVDATGKTIPNKWVSKIETKPNTEVRIGSIEILKRIAVDSERDRQSIKHILASYIRENTREQTSHYHEVKQNWDEEEYGPIDENDFLDSLGTTSEDVTSALNAIIFLNNEFGYSDHIDLSGIMIISAPIKHQKIQGLNLTYSRIIRTNFSNKHLIDLIIENTEMEDCRFHGANLQKVSQDPMMKWNNNYFSDTTIPPEGYILISTGDGLFSSFKLERIS